MQSINGTNAFTKLLAHQLKLINDLKPFLSNERAQIKSDIASLKVIEKSKLTSFFRDTDLKRLYDATDNYFAAPSPVTLEAVTKARDKIKGSDLLSPALDKQIDLLKANHAKIDNLTQQKKDISKQINTFITDYLNQHANDKDDLHTAKKNVMKAIQTYVNEPTADNWKSLDKSTQDNPGWDKGFFSKVSSVMDKARDFHDEIEQRSPMNGA
ncbi:hypothetical protein [Legionella sp. km772]|uniref:hypothetical protein n=1 Tax=Legionella sp. km772 TaxID=2498111 RepID=UPI000F8E3F80|nr:hypothetical protein [Legionella sp. km772]RUR08496.1 hypothetical protein ELY15_10680 [Legionella sp. km772]